MRWFGGAATAAAAAITASAAAFAQPAATATASSVELAWSAPAQCPSRAAVLGEVQAILEGGATPARPVEASATVTRAGQRWRVSLAIRSEQGSGARSLDADSCAELASAVALIVALAVDPTRRLPPPREPTSPSGGAGASGAEDAGATATDSAATSGADATTPAPLREPSPPAEPRGSSDSERGPRVAVGVEAAADFGALPSAALGGEASLAVLYWRARLEARGRLLASQRASDPARPVQGVALSHLGFDARACFAAVATGRAARDGLTVGPCLGIAVTRLSGTGFGGTKTFAGDASWTSVEGGLFATWALTSFVALRVGADLLAPTSRPAFVVLAADGSTAGRLHRAAPFGGRLDLGAEIRFW